MGGLFRGRSERTCATTSRTGACRSEPQRTARTLGGRLASTSAAGDANGRTSADCNHADFEQAEHRDVAAQGTQHVSCVQRSLRNTRRDPARRPVAAGEVLAGGTRQVRTRQEGSRDRGRCIRHFAGFRRRLCAPRDDATVQYDHRGDPCAPWRRHMARPVRQAFAPVG